MVYRFDKNLCYGLSDSLSFICKRQCSYFNGLNVFYFTPEKHEQMILLYLIISDGNKSFIFLRCSTFKLIILLCLPKNTINSHLCLLAYRSH